MTFEEFKSDFFRGKYCHGRNGFSQFNFARACWDFWEERYAQDMHAAEEKLWETEFDYSFLLAREKRKFSAEDAELCAKVVYLETKLGLCKQYVPEEEWKKMDEFIYSEDNR